MNRRLIVCLLMAFAFAWAIGSARAQSRILDTSAPVRFNLETKQVAWPAQGFWESNQVVRGVAGTAALSSGAVTVTNADISASDIVIASWASTGKVGHVVATAASGTVTFTSSATNDQTGNISYLAIGQ